MTYEEKQLEKMTKCELIILIKQINPNLHLCSLWSSKKRKLIKYLKQKGENKNESN